MERIKGILILFRRLIQRPVTRLPSNGLSVFDTRKCHTQHGVKSAPAVMRVSNEHFDGDNGIRPFPGKREAGVDRDAARLARLDGSFCGRVDWSRAEAQAEAEFSVQRDRLIHRLHDRDYPYPQVIKQLAKLVAGNSN